MDGKNGIAHTEVFIINIIIVPTTTTTTTTTTTIIMISRFQEYPYGPKFYEQMTGEWLRVSKGYMNR